VTLFGKAANDHPVDGIALIGICERIGVGGRAKYFAAQYELP